MRRIVLLLWLLIASNAGAVQRDVPKPDAEHEIAVLIDTLARFGCESERNGSWYSATRAKSHLSGKYEWLRKRKLADAA